MMKARLHKILAQATELSRRAAEKEIAAGRVSVNGAAVTEMGTFADPSVDDIRWRGRRVFPAREKIYLVYHKPKNLLVTKKDSLGRPTIWRDIRNFKDRVNAVGRLDYDSEGLLILTNDGELLNRLTHPSFAIGKTYNVKVRGFPSDEGIGALRKGVAYKGVVYQPAEIRVKSRTEKHTWLEVRIYEGKNREIRNMFASTGHPVLKLSRIAIGPVRLGRLEAGKCRFMTKKELDLLRKALKEC